jgi:hypothetical protein
MLVQFGGHIDFEKYRQIFRSLYCVEPIIDVMKRRVLFDSEPLLDDCAHVCYGGDKGRAYRSDCWYPNRAKRINYIGLALTNPNKIHPDKDNPTNQKYLLYLPAEGDLPAEHFCVIVRLINKYTVSFLTAYDVDFKTFAAYGNVAPRLYPPQKPKERGKKKK